MKYLHVCTVFLHHVHQVNELQADLSKLQSQQVSLQLEHKELKKKQRRSERYYTNKQSKDSGSQNDSVQGDEVEMVGDVSLQDELTPDDRSEEGWYYVTCIIQCTLRCVGNNKIIVIVPRS